MAKLNWHKVSKQSKEQTSLDRPFFTNPKTGFDKKWHEKAAKNKAKQDRLIRDKAMASIKAKKS